ncbi:hypothetical protein C495_16620 [Natronorubrum sulfidifaciens JCM 14089]|uniref:Uncharacterized protein n=1 Tax=Natronorubrum sulfidifaciens JCM 14089 TaxID=1230460 RepID=L9VX45_9EURY|nr:hypothetical protein C495_16620 [Natronorubrum sulfidifaciens JCM 14089]
MFQRSKYSHSVQQRIHLFQRGSSGLIRFLRVFSSYSWTEHSILRKYVRFGSTSGGLSEATTQFTISKVMKMRPGNVDGIDTQNQRHLESISIRHQTRPQI